jgi:hypothetical protein
LGGAKQIRGAQPPHEIRDFQKKKKHSYREIETKNNVECKWPQKKIKYWYGTYFLLVE